MLKWFLIYALFAAIVITPWFTMACKDEIDGDVGRVAEETGATKAQTLIVLYLILVLLGWAWLPYKIVRVTIKKIQGE